MRRVGHCSQREEAVKAHRCVMVSCEEHCRCVGGGGGGGGKLTWVRRGQGAEALHTQAMGLRTGLGTQQEVSYQGFQLKKLFYSGDFGTFVSLHLGLYFFRLCITA